MYWSFLEILKPSETCYVENIKSTNFILGTNTKSTNLWIHKIVIFIQTTKIDTHEEKYFHSSHIYLVVTIYFGVIKSKIKVTITINRISDNKVVSAW
jgi:hypothetical protein